MNSFYERRKEILKKMAYEISMPLKLVKKSRRLDFENFSEEDNYYFFGLEHMLLITEPFEGGEKLKDFCLNGVGKSFHLESFVKGFKRLDGEDWNEVFDYVLERKLEIDSSGVGINPKDSKINQGYLRLKRAVENYIGDFNVPN
jgi:hypothetical protein